jgi:hypothetical protein
MPATDAERAAVMEAWGKWYGVLGAAVVDGGNPVGQTRTIAASGATTDGGGANPVTGYSLIKADNLDAAVAMAKGCPVLAGGGSIEVAETFEAM